MTIKQRVNELEKPIPTKEQLFKAEHSHNRWMLNFFNGMCISAHSYAVSCLEYEKITGSPAQW